MYGTQSKAFVLQHAGDIHTVGHISTLAKVAEAAGIETTRSLWSLSSDQYELLQLRS